MSDFDMFDVEAKSDVSIVPEPVPAKTKPAGHRKAGRRKAAKRSATTAAEAPKAKKPAATAVAKQRKKVKASVVKDNHDSDASSVLNGNDGFAADSDDEEAEAEEDEEPEDPEQDLGGVESDSVLTMLQATSGRGGSSSKKSRKQQVTEKAERHGDKAAKLVAKEIELCYRKRANADKKSHSKFSKKLVALVDAARKAQAISAVTFSKQLEQVKAAEKSCSARNTEARLIQKELEMLYNVRRKDMGLLDKHTDSEKAIALNKIKITTAALRKNLSRNMKATKSDADSKKQQRFMTSMFAQMF
jgi:hypothetical protein